MSRNLQTANILLDRLTDLAANSMRENITRVTHASGHVIYEAGDEVDFVYFPESGMLSLLTVMANGKAIETATVGREGVVGAMAGLGLYETQVRVVVQLPASCSRISAAAFRKSAQRHDEITNLCIAYNEVLLTQARVTAGCNAHHNIDQRMCRWLLQSADRAESATFGLTQEMLSEMLGVRRTSMTSTARNLQSAGMITFSRGRISIVDRPALEARSCDCYRTLVEQGAGLLPAQRPV
jgi:CRP-like cAMP-binding protein